MDDPFSAQIYQAQQQQQQHKAAASSAPLKKPPKWLRRPCGATFAVCVANRISTCSRSTANIIWAPMFPSDINTQFVRKDTSRNGYLHKQYIDILY